ncbi:MAG: polysaccharide deacetylase family protein [Candidatus Binatia bacterium]
MATSIPILTFHAVDDRPSVISFAPRLFESGISRLHGAGYRTLSLLELVDCIRRGVSFPERSLALTFDDGYQSVYDHAFPILQRYGFSATVFLTVGKMREKTAAERLPSMEGRSMLSWREIKEMQRWGIAFGAHTLTHPDLTRLRVDQLEAEVVSGKDVIEDALGAQVNSFAYPFGRYDQQCREIVSRHFVCACSDRLGLLRAGSDPYAMERVDSYYLRSEKLFAAIPTKFFPLYIHARAVPRQLRRTVKLNIANRFQR